MINCRKRHANKAACHTETARHLLTLRAGKGIGFDICTASPVFSSTSAYNVGHCRQENE